MNLQRVKAYPGLLLRRCTPPGTSNISSMATEFKLSGVTSLNLADGEKREVQVEGVEGGKVLLSRVQGAHYCTSAYCSHYGAPLQKGVLSNVSGHFTSLESSASG